MNKFEDSFLSTEALEKERSDIEDFYKTKVQKLSFKTKDGYTITAAKMDAEDSTDTLVIIPGRGEIPHKFAEFLYTLNLLNISAVIPFARGQAESTRLLQDPQKCHINHFEDLAKDDLFILDKLEIKNYKLLAFSLGGLISLDIIKNFKNKPSKAALIAPYLWPFFNLPKPLLTCLVMTFGSLPFLSTMYTPHGKEYKKVPFDINHHSHCKERYESYHDYYAKHPELTIGGPTYRFVKEAMRKQMEIIDSTFTFTIPVYCQSAGNDKVVSTAVAEHFFENHQGDPVPPKFEIIDNAYHDLINESDNFRIRSLSNALDFLFN